MSITIALCDDEEEQVKLLRRILTSWSADKPFVVNIKEYDCAESFLFDYSDTPCDLLLLDIEMKNLNGMELAHKLRDRSDMLPIIFITGYGDYISEGYDVEALHYLLKPIDKHRLFNVLDKYISRRDSRSNELLVEADEQTLHISAENIMYLEAFGRKTELHMSDKSVVKSNMSIGTFQKKDLFLICHRSYLVNLRYVKSIGKTALYLDDGEQIPLSRRLYNDVNKKFIEYYTKEKM